MKVGNRKGFSLIEIGIVMVVIGLIIAAVMKGKDVIGNAEIKKINQEFFNKWVNIADGYYDKTGRNLSDVADITADSNVTTDKLQAAGFEYPETSLSITGETITSTVTVGFKSNDVDTADKTREIVWFQDVPGDIAIAYDKLVDGVYDGTDGKARIIDIDTVDTNATITGTSVEDSSTKYDVIVVLDR